MPGGGDADVAEYRLIARALRTPPLDAVAERFRGTNGRARAARAARRERERRGLARARARRVAARSPAAWRSPSSTASRCSDVSFSVPDGAAPGIQTVVSWSIAVAACVGLSSVFALAGKPSFAPRRSMDPIAHTFTGMALAAAGLRRATPLAATALFMGVNAPDVDVFRPSGPDQASLAFRRGWTHGVLALVLWPFVLTGVLLAWDRYVRLRRKPDAAPARAGPLLALTALAVVTHPALDWLNNYGLALAHAVRRRVVLRRRAVRHRSVALARCSAALRS